MHPQLRIIGAFCDEVTPQIVRCVCVMGDWNLRFLALCLSLTTLEGIKSGSVYQSSISPSCTLTRRRRTYETLGNRIRPHNCLRPMIHV